VIRLPFAIVARRLLWLPPLFVLGLVLAFVYASTGPALSTYVVTAIPLAGIGLWLTVIAGSCDDDSHRELMAARAGSVARIHAARAVCGAAFVALFSLLCTVLPLVFGVLRYQPPADPHRLPSNAVILASGLALHLAAGLVGVAGGTFLHRPLLQRTPLAALAGVALSALLVFLPPVLAVLRALDRSDPAGAPWFLLAALAIACIAVAFASRLAARR
jgi:hypothetical protein